MKGVCDYKMTSNTKISLKTSTKHWYDYMWIFTLIYLSLGMFNILFAWLGMICFITPLVISSLGYGKAYCNRYCGRGQLFNLLGHNFKLSRNKPMPKWMKSKYFRYGFLIFFLTMFINMLFNTYLVFNGTNNLKEVITLLWTFKLPWNFADLTSITPWIAQFAFGFFSVMLTSTILGLITMALYKPRSWCVYCPMGTMTQCICKLKNKK